MRKRSTLVSPPFISSLWSPHLQCKIALSLYFFHFTLSLITECWWVRRNIQALTETPGLVLRAVWVRGARRAGEVKAALPILAS